MLDPTTACALVVIFVATLVRSTVGFGEALVAVPLLALRMPVTAGLWRPVVTRYFPLSIPGVLLAVPAGRWCNSRLRGDRFYRLVYAGLIVIGAVLIGQAIARS